MREYVEPTPTNLQAFSTGRILKESWEISVRYFGALMMPMVLMMAPGIALVLLVPGKGGEALNNLLSFFLTPLVLMGLHRSVLLLKSDGHAPTFGGTFSHGNEYWWRGFKIGLVTGLYCIPLIIVIAILIVPGAMLSDKDPSVGLPLLIIGSLASIGLTAWFCARACLAYACMADNQTSATKAFDYGWNLTKGNLGHLMRLGSGICGSGLLIVLGFILVGAAAVGLELCNTLTVVGLLMIPGMFVYLCFISYTHVATNLAYQVLKPAQAEVPSPTV